LETVIVAFAAAGDFVTHVVPPSREYSTFVIVFAEYALYVLIENVTDPAARLWMYTDGALGAPGYTVMGLDATPGTPLAPPVFIARTKVV